MTYDEKLSKQEAIDQLCLEGKPWKLDKLSYRPGDVDKWERCLMNDFEYRDSHFISQMRIIWKKTDLHGGPNSDLNCPVYGVAGNIAQLQYFMKDNRFHRERVGIELGIWNKILELDEVIMPERDDSVENDSSSNKSSRSEGLHIDDFESTLETTKNSEFETHETVTPTTPDYILEALDKIVEYLTGRFYFCHRDVGAKFENYINDYDLNVEIMGTFLRKGRLFLPEEIICQFEGGFLSS